MGNFIMPSHRRVKTQTANDQIRDPAYLSHMEDKSQQQIDKFLANEDKSTRKRSNRTQGMFIEVKSGKDDNKTSDNKQWPYLLFQWPP